MLFETIELTMSHVGLGALNEYALMVLFGNAHSHHLVMGTSHTPSEIIDNREQRLYPAYFMTHLKVPPTRLLNSFTLWDKVCVGVEVRRFGDTLLESDYLLGRAQEVTPSPEMFDRGDLPTMKASNLIVVDVSETDGQGRQVAIPMKSSIADLPKVKKTPAAIRQSKTIREQGFDPLPGSYTFQTRTPVSYVVEPGRDAAAGHAMMFAKFCEIMDFAEFKLLSAYTEPGFPYEMLHHMHVLERETYYYGNSYTNEAIQIHVRATMTPCERDAFGDAVNLFSLARFTIDMEIEQQGTRVLKALSRTVKLLAMPASMQNLFSDAKRLVRLYANA